LVEKRNNVDVLAAVDTPRQGDIGGMKVLQDHKEGEYTKGRVQALKSGEKWF
jgi:hypothetical protein